MPYAGRFSLVPQSRPCLSHIASLQNIGHRTFYRLKELDQKIHESSWPCQSFFTETNTPREWIYEYIYFDLFLMGLYLLQGSVVSQHLEPTVLWEQTAHSQSGPQKDKKERARSQYLFLGHAPHLKCSTASHYHDGDPSSTLGDSSYLK